MSEHKLWIVVSNDGLKAYATLIEAVSANNMEILKKIKLVQAISLASCLVFTCFVLLLIMKEWLWTGLEEW